MRHTICSTHSSYWRLLLTVCATVFGERGARYLLQEDISVLELPDFTIWSLRSLFQSPLSSGLTFGRVSWTRFAGDGRAVNGTSEN